MGVDSGIGKPDPQLFLQACQKLGVASANALMVGDAPTDIEMAKQAGAAGAIGICWGQPEVNYLVEADVAIANLEDIQVFSP